MTHEAGGSGSMLAAIFLQRRSQQFGGVARGYAQTGNRAGDTPAGRSAMLRRAGMGLQLIGTEYWVLGSRKVVRQSHIMP